MSTLMSLLPLGALGPLIFENLAISPPNLQDIDVVNVPISIRVEVPTAPSADLLGAEGAVELSKISPVDAAIAISVAQEAMESR